VGAGRAAVVLGWRMAGTLLIVARITGQGYSADDDAEAEGSPDKTRLLGDQPLIGLSAPWP
jgi:hypothetical protein